ncbi:hypothetical protein BT96DRAFT_943027 [Gymnopus androsaceus JB14]|uniref:Protein kinase domain-containing protein n=1 Tax=Gymnopus androsaceus JB14 TaxID=1447944 RepID=A0A6A4HA47_9AGAR|nr:hypothetical protein BT96DRAFT_943027 [Gymnopus androsaceus JB14]
MKSKIPSVIRDVLEFNLDVAQHDRRAARHLSIPSTPLTFQDKHLDANYILKRVVFLPNLLTELSTFVDGLLESVEEFPDKDLPSSESLDDEINPISGFTSIAFDPSADQVAAHYHESIATQCCSLASFLVLHSKYPGWTSYLSWKQPWKQSTPEWEEWLITHKPRSLILNKTSPRSSKIQEFTELQRSKGFGTSFRVDLNMNHSPCIPEVVPGHSRILHGEMGMGIWHGRGHALKDTIHEPSHCSYDRYPDASGTPWTLPPDLSVRKKKELPVVLAEDYLQNAWARCRAHDATFIIFHRGANEIICIRHRASQTLYVSEIIDTCTNYGKLQTALYAAILKDKADRQEIWEKKHPPRPEQKEETKKRPLESQKDSSRKRSRSNSDCGAHPFKVISHFQAYNMKVRHFILNFWCIDNLILLGTMQEPRCPRSLHFLCGSQTCQQRTIRSRKHLRHEFSIYEHLARAKVQAVPHLYGLFEDVESENSQLILVTSYAGESLAVIHMSRPVFLHQLAEIHEAGIHHRDLRPPNIVVDHDGKITFIDFDKARSYVTGKQRKHERKRLLNLMNGRYVDYDRTSLTKLGSSVF